MAIRSKINGIGKLYERDRTKQGHEMDSRMEGRK
jgi:hypothetical protein